jgi:hypothetical protein
MGMPATHIENVGMPQNNGAIEHHTDVPGPNTESVTLIELVIPVVIIGILAAEAIPQFIDLSNDAKNGTLPLPLPENIINIIGLGVDHGLLDHSLG